MEWAIWGLSSLVCIGVVNFGVNTYKEYKIRRRKRELMEWLHYVGICMDILWKDETPYSKYQVKEWLAKLTTTHFEGVKERERK